MVYTTDEFAQKIKSKYPEYANVDNNTLATKMVDKYPEYRDQISFEQKKPTLFQNVKDVWEWVVWFAGWIPKAIAWTRLFDKPMAKLAQAAWFLANKAGYNVKTPEQIQQAVKEQPFSAYAKGSQVGGDPTSKTARTTEWILDTAEAVTAIPGLIKWGLKIAGKKALKDAISKWEVTEKVLKKWGAGKILDMIKEWEAARNKVSALWRWGITDQSKLSKRWKWSKDVVKPSKKTLEWVATVVEEIPKSNKMWAQELYTQIWNKISEISEWLKTQLWQIKTWTQTAKLKALKGALTNLYDEVADYSKPTANAIKKAKAEILKSKNAKDAWDAAKKLDNLIPESIKKWASQGKDALVYGKRRGAREAFNDYIDDVAEWVQDVNVKSTFKKISNLYRAKWWIEENIVQLTKPVVWMASKLKSLWGKALIWAWWLVAAKMFLRKGKGWDASDYIAE